MRFAPRLSLAFVTACVFAGLIGIAAPSSALAQFCNVGDQILRDGSCRHIAAGPDRCRRGETWNASAHGCDHPSACKPGQYPRRDGACAAIPPMPVCQPGEYLDRGRRTCIHVVRRAPDAQNNVEPNRTISNRPGAGAAKRHRPVHEEVLGRLRARSGAGPGRGRAGHGSTVPTGMRELVWFRARGRPSSRVTRSDPD